MCTQKHHLDVGIIDQESKVRYLFYQREHAKADFRKRAAETMITQAKVSLEKSRQYRKEHLFECPNCSLVSAPNGGDQ